jgi:co-chaperonin GroES (HSP10)|tara:strand:+ start:957 stop:1370 length:414 start_codon:yes stop_codon:yes gene_type:complete
MQMPIAGALKNDEWIEDADKPDPKKLPKLNGYHILVRPVSVKAKTKSGIILPDSTRDDMAYLTTVGRVISLGDTAYQDKEKFPNGPWCKVGDTISYHKHVGTKMIYKGIKLLLIYDDQAVMTLDDASDLDPTYNLSN